MTTALVEPPDVHDLKCRYVPVHHQKSTWGANVSVLNHTQISLLYGQLLVTVKKKSPEKCSASQYRLSSSWDASNIQAPKVLCIWVAFSEHLIVFILHSE